MGNICDCIRGADSNEVNLEEQSKKNANTAEVDATEKNATAKEESESPNKAEDAPTESAEKTEVVELNSIKPEGASSEEKTEVTAGKETGTTAVEAEDADRLKTGEEKVEVTASDTQAVNEEQPIVESKDEVKDNAPASSIEVPEEPLIVGTSEANVPQKDPDVEGKTSEVPETSVKKSDTDEVQATLETPESVTKDSELPQEDAARVDIQNGVSAQDENISKEPTLEEAVNIANVSKDSKVDDVLKDVTSATEQEDKGENPLLPAPSKDDQMVENRAKDDTGGNRPSEEPAPGTQPDQPVVDLQVTSALPSAAGVESTEKAAVEAEILPDETNTDVIMETFPEEKTNVLDTDVTHSGPEVDEVLPATELKDEVQPVEASVEPEVKAAEPIETTPEPVLEVQSEETFAEQSLPSETSAVPVISSADLEVKEVETDMKTEPEVILVEPPEEIEIVEAVTEQEVMEEMKEEREVKVEETEETIAEVLEAVAEKEAETQLQETNTELEVDDAQLEEKRTETEEDQPDGTPVERAPAGSTPEPSESSLLEAAEKFVDEVMNDSIRAYNENTAEAGEDLPHQQEDQPDAAIVEDAEMQDDSASDSKAEAAELTEPEVLSSEGQTQAPVVVEVIEVKDETSSDVQSVPEGFTAETVDTVAESLETVEDDPQPKDILEASQEEDVVEVLPAVVQEAAEVEEDEGSNLESAPSKLIPETVDTIAKSEEDTPTNEDSSSKTVTDSVETEGQPSVPHGEEIAQLEEGTNLESTPSEILPETVETIAVSETESAIKEDSPSKEATENVQSEEEDQLPAVVIEEIVVDEEENKLESAPLKLVPETVETIAISEPESHTDEGAPSKTAVETTPEKEEPPTVTPTATIDLELGRESEIVEVSDKSEVDDTSAIVSQQSDEPKVELECLPLEDREGESPAKEETEEPEKLPQVVGELLDDPVTAVESAVSLTEEVPAEVAQAAAEMED